jgi:NAD(P)-dependent dehydrogenase (short-subunit alcohol dehydrogenase family)
VLRATGDRGVDAVLAVAGRSALREALSVLAPLGRLLLISSHGPPATAADLGDIRRNVSVHVVALDELSSARPAELAELAREALSLFEAGAFKPPPTERFSISKALEAFERAARNERLDEVVVEAAETVSVREPSSRVVVRADRTYLIAGALCRLAFATAARLVERGARHVALVGRLSPDADAQERIAEMDQLGARVTVVRADLSKAVEIEAALRGLAESSPPLAGVVHCPRVPEGRKLLELDTETFDRTMQEGAGATWNLHRATARRDLDFFVLFSSAVAVLGGPGGASAAALCAFADGVALYRASRGLAAQTIDWGDVADEAIAADIFMRLLEDAAPQLIAMEFHLRAWRHLHPRAASMRLLGELTEAADSEGGVEAAGILSTIGAAPGRRRGEVLEDWLRRTVASLTHVSSESIRKDAPFKSLGMDSQRMVALTNVIERDLNVSFSTSTLFGRPSIERLGAWLLERLFATSAPEPPDPVGPVPEHHGALEDAVAAELRELAKRGFIDG